MAKEKERGAWGERERGSLEPLERGEEREFFGSLTPTLPQTRYFGQGKVHTSITPKVRANAQESFYPAMCAQALYYS